MNDRQMLEAILQLNKQNQQGILELKDDVSELRTGVADLKVRVTNIEERVTNIEERLTNVEDNMVRKTDLKYYEFKIAEHDREIFQLKQH